MPDTVVLLRHLDIYLVSFFFFCWFDYRCDFSWTFPPVLLLHPKLASFLCACQSLNESRLYTYIIWVAVNHEPAINYAAIWPAHLEEWTVLIWFLQLHTALMVEGLWQNDSQKGMLFRAFLKNCFSMIFWGENIRLLQMMNHGHWKQVYIIPQTCCNI